MINSEIVLELAKQSLAENLSNEYEVNSSTFNNISPLKRLDTHFFLNIFLIDMKAKLIILVKITFTKMWQLCSAYSSLFFLFVTFLNQMY